MAARVGLRTAIAMVLLAASLASNTIAPAHADCGDPGQDACAGPVPTVDQIVDIMQQLTDPNIPAANKGNIVTPPFSPDEASTADNRLHQIVRYLPLNWVITNIQPAPNNFAGATMQTTGSFFQTSGAGPIVLVEQNGHWLLTHRSAVDSIHTVWRNATTFIPATPRG